MKTILKLIAIILTASVVSLACESLALAETVDFTSHLYSARALSLAGSVIALPSATDAMFINPAGLSNLKQKNLFSSSYGQEFDGQNYFTALNYSFAVDGIFLGLSLPYQTTDSLSLTQIGPDGRPQVTGYFSDSKYGVMLSAAKEFSPEISLGATIKWLHHQIYNNSAKNFGFDLGAIYQMPETFMGGKISLGLTGQNLLASDKIWTSGRTEKTERNFSAGLAYQTNLLNFSAAVGYAPGAGTESSLGLEYFISQTMALRGGFSRDKLFIGAGLNLKNISLDYAYSLHQELGNSHRVSVSYGF